MKKPPEPLSKEEMEKIIVASMDDDFFYMLFSVAKTTGRRLGEYWNIKVKDIDFNTNMMKTIVLKARRYVKRDAILSPEVSRLVQKHIVSLKLGPEDFVFRTRCSYRQIQNKIKYYGRKAGIQKNVVFHNFRHYLITELVKLGWSYAKISKITGHTNPQIISTYDHVVAQDFKEDMLSAIKTI